MRVVCATHQDLKDLIAKGRFREDLYYRLAEIVVDIPPLRARHGDAALLAHIVRAAFRVRAAARHDDAAARGDRRDRGAAWPGNVRELENVIKRAVIMAEASTIRARTSASRRRRPTRDALNLRQVRDEAEKHAVTRVLGRASTAT